MRITSPKLGFGLSALLAICLGMILAVTTSAWLDGGSQTNKRKVVEQRSLIRPDIVPIVEIEHDTKSLSFGQEFEASEEWLRTTRFRVRNDSGKEIVYISFEIEFPETSSSGNVMVFPIWLGHRPGSLALDKKEPLSLKPDTALTISIDDRTYSQLARFIETRQPISTINKVIARVQFVAFDDETGWSGGEYLRQDPRNPKLYVPITNNPN